MFDGTLVKLQISCGTPDDLSRNNSFPRNTGWKSLFYVNNCCFWARTTVLSCYRNWWCSKCSQRMRWLAKADKIKTIVSDKVNYRGTRSYTCVMDERSAKSGDMVPGCRQWARFPSKQFRIASWPICNVPWNLHANSLQVCTFHDGCKQGINQQIFNRKSISRKITHPQSLFK